MSQPGQVKDFHPVNTTETGDINKYFNLLIAKEVVVHSSQRLMFNCLTAQIEFAEGGKPKDPGKKPSESD